MVGQRVQNPTPGQEGWLRSRLLEGTDVYVAFATAPLSGWRVVLTAPVAAVDGPLRRLIWQMLAGAAAAAAMRGPPGLHLRPADREGGGRARRHRPRGGARRAGPAPVDRA